MPRPCVGGASAGCRRGRVAQRPAYCNARIARSRQERGLARTAEHRTTTDGRPMSTPETEPFTKSLERMNRFQEPEARALIADLRLPEGSHGLDVGCGVGLWTLWLAEAVGPSGRVVGIEPSAERADAARALAGAALPPSRLEFRASDGTAVDAPDASFDWVWCGVVLR